MKFQILFRSGSRAAAAAVCACAAALTLSALGATGAGAQGQESAEQQRQQFGDTIVTADSIDYDLDKRQVVAVGNVDLVSRNSHLTADNMTVQMRPNRGLEWARAEGNVFLEKTNPEDNTVFTGRGRKAEYFETEQKANLQGGDVILHISSPRLARPAVITGARVDMNLQTKQNIVVRKADAQAKVHVEPKGEEGKPEPEPVDLVADRIEMNSEKQTYVATGNPVLVRPTSRLAADVIRFEVEEKTQDVKVAYAERNVVFDGQSASGTVLHATGDHGVFTRDVNEIVLTGMVTATTKGPDEEKPTLYQGSKFLYNTKTRASRLIGGGTGKPARVVLPQNAVAGTVGKDAGPAEAGKEKK